MLTLKATTYNGTHPRAWGMVEYIVVNRREVYFSGVALDKPYTKTVNAAAGVIESICREEGLNWRLITFYDIMQTECYGKLEGMRGEHEYKITKLHVESSCSGSQYPQVTRREPLLNSDVPEEILSMFVEIDPEYDKDIVLWKNRELG